MTLVREILESKGHGFYSTSPASMVYEAIRLMSEKSVGSLLVMEDGRLLGIITERDYARKVILEGKSSKETPVRDIMTTPVLYVGPDQTIDECMALVTDARIRHLPVMEDDKVVGVLSIGDLVKSIISEQKFVIEQLQRYITG